jgi:hypothetical protein
MNDNNYNINPCKSAIYKCPDDTDVNCRNNTCMETLAAFMGASSINEIRNTPEAQNCVACMDNAIHCMGSNTCDLRLTLAPTFNQTPHYFPELLNKTKDVKKAKDMCMNWCQDCKNCTNSCMENCNTDSMAVETFDKKKDESTPKTGKPDYRTTNPISFYTAFFIGTILFMFIIYLFIKVILQQQ